MYHLFCQKYQLTQQNCACCETLLGQIAPNYANEGTVPFTEYITVDVSDTTVYRINQQIGLHQQSVVTLTLLTVEPLEEPKKTKPGRLLNLGLWIILQTENRTTAMDNIVSRDIANIFIGIVGCCFLASCPEQGWQSACCRINCFIKAMPCACVYRRERFEKMLMSDSEQGTRFSLSLSLFQIQGLSPNVVFSVCFES